MVIVEAVACADINIIAYNFGNKWVLYAGGLIGNLRQSSFRIELSKDRIDKTSS